MTQVQERKARRRSLWRNQAYMLLWGGDPIGLALTGFLLQIWNVQGVVSVYASGLLVLALGATLSRKVRDLRSIAAPVEAAGA